MAPTSGRHAARASAVAQAAEASALADVLAPAHVPGVARVREAHVDVAHRVPHRAAVGAHGAGVDCVKAAIGVFAAAA